MNRLAVLLACSLGVVFFGFAPDLARAAHLEPDSAWRVSAFLFASYHLAIVLGSIWARPPRAPFGSRLFLPAVFAGGFFLILAQFLTAAGFLPSWLFFFYLLNLLWMLLMSALVLALLLLDPDSSTPAV